MELIIRQPEIYDILRILTEVAKKVDGHEKIRLNGVINRLKYSVLPRLEKAFNITDKVTNYAYHNLQPEFFEEDKKKVWDEVREIEDANICLYAICKEVEDNFDFYDSYENLPEE